MLENDHSMSVDDDEDLVTDPDCIAVIFEFINFLIEAKLAADRKTFPELVKIALKWIDTDLVSSHALAILRSVAVNVEPAVDNDILEPLIKGLPVFLITLNRSRTEEMPDFMEHNRKVTGRWHKGSFSRKIELTIFF